jgi:PD-(D/E)XK nuclease superfamily
MSSLDAFLGPYTAPIQPPAEPDVTGLGVYAPTTGLLAQHVHHLSASSLGMVLRCPRQFYRRYILGEKQRPGESIVIGSFFHETLDWNYKQKVESHTDYALSDAVQYLQDEAVPKVIEEEGGVDNILWDSDLDTARSDAERITSAYYRHVVPRIQPVGTEERFEIRVPGVEVPIIGYVDVKSGTEVEMDTTSVWVPDRILDTKTGKQATRTVKPSWQLQGRLYAQAQNLPVEYHSISRAKTPTIVTALESEGMVVPVPSEAQIRNMNHTIKVAADYIEYLLATFGVDEEWPALGAVPDFTRNMLPCNFCGWREGCPAWA